MRRPRKLFNRATAPTLEWSTKHQRFFILKTVKIRPRKPSKPGVRSTK